MKFDKILAFDTESCDGHIDNGSLCSFGYCLADSEMQVERREDLLVNPLPKRFYVGKGGKSGIWFAYPESEFRRAPRFDAVYPRIAELFRGNVLAVGHALRNDLRYLDSACRLYGLPSLSFTYLDSELLYRLYRDEACPTGLKAACAHFSLSFTEHRSDEDALASLLLVRSICAAQGRTLEELVGEWQITLGRYEDYSATACFTDRAIGGVPAFVPTSVNSRKLLVLDAQEHLRVNREAPDNPFKGKKVWLDNEVKFKDSVLTRRIFLKLSSLGAEISGVWHCDVAVLARACEGKGLRENSVMFKRGTRCTDLPGLLRELGDLPDCSFDDVAKLRELKRVVFRKESAGDTSASPG